LYRERIYFPADADEQEAFLLEPSKYVNGGESVPNDILVKPQISILGLPKSGKTELCQRIQACTGAVHLNMEQIIEEQIHRDAIFAKNLRDSTMFAGQAFDDEALIKLLHRRLQAPDCKRNGWVIENFPQTREQALLMAQKSILPNNVLTIHVNPSVCYQRAKGDDSFDYINDILKLRIENTLINQPQVNMFFQKYYNSVTSIDGTRSRWFVENIALQAIEATLKARMQFVHNYYGTLSEESPCVMQNMNIDRIYLKQSLSQYRYMCPVTWKMKKTFVSCAHRPEFSVLYRH
jgi:adenylate kinase family enzyme